MPTETNQYDAEYIKRYTGRPWYRKKLRKLELFPAIWLTRGSTIDFGCGTGDLLDVLPKGSVGLDINPYAVDYCTAQGLDAILYDAYSDDFQLTPLRERDARFESLAMCHLLEHLPDAATLMPKLFGAARDLGVSRIVITVPGRKGYDRDETHCTFVNPAYIRTNDLERISGFRLTAEHFHPFPFEAAGNYFAENTYVMLYCDEQT
jgi:SAM-dependent methyltransferase